MNQITDPNVRARRITRTSYVGIGANLLLAGFKAAVGLLSNSVAIVLDAFHVFLTVGIYAVDPARRADRDAIEAAAKRRPGVKAVHGVFFDDERAAVTFDVLVDFTVRDRAALRAAILADLAPRFPGRTLSLNFDTDYSD